MNADKPIVLVTGVAGDIGSALAATLADGYRVVGLDRVAPKGDLDWLEIDFSSDESVASAMRRFRQRYGNRIASVVHLAAYFDFTGENNPLYEMVNVEGTRRLLYALRGFEVEQLVYSGTMLIHAACAPGERIDESAPIAPKWAYPKSKAAAEQVIAEEHGDIPYVLLHLAGLYDDETAVPTLSQQIARVYEREMKSHLYAGDLRAGQSMLHKDDMIDAFRRAIDRRSQLPREVTILIGEPDAPSYEALQQRLGRLIHDEDDWRTLTLPSPLAKAGAWLEAAAEPMIPDAVDQGEKPFIRPFMIELASDHYALDIGRARELLDWTPRHNIVQTLPLLVQALKRDPLAWYEANGITPPPWLASAAGRVDDADALRRNAEAAFRSEHRQNLWARFMTVAVGSWLVTSPVTMDYAGTPLAISDIVAGALLVVVGLLTLSWRTAPLRWLAAFIGLWLLFAPLVFWTPSAAGYLNSTLMGTLAIAFSVLARPAPGVGRLAAMTGPDIPPGWDYSPSSWSQRALIIVLAFIGLYVSRYMTAYQLGHIDGVWEPFFAGTRPGLNGTEDIITSSVSEAWPVPDAGLGAVTYLLEILVGLMGSARRWRTMPWVVILFGILIVPLGVVSITFIIIQPIVIGTWCTLCLIGAAAMLLQIPYSLDELVATCQFLYRRKKAGQHLLRVFFAGDTDEGDRREGAGGGTREFEQPPGEVVRSLFGGHVGLPWNLAVCIGIGLWLMATRLTVGAEGAMANADHLIGALVVTMSVTALAEVARSARLLNIPLGVALLITPFAFDAPTASTVASLVCGLALIGLSLRRGPVTGRHGGWNRYIL